MYYTACRLAVDGVLGLLWSPSLLPGKELLNTEGGWVQGATVWRWQRSGWERNERLGASMRLVEMVASGRLRLNYSQG